MLPQNSSLLANCSSFLTCNFPSLSHMVTVLSRWEAPNEPLLRDAYLKRSLFFVRWNKQYCTSLCSSGWSDIGYFYVTVIWMISLRYQWAPQTLGLSPCHQNSNFHSCISLLQQLWTHCSWKNEHIQSCFVFTHAAYVSSMPSKKVSASISTVNPWL